MFVCHHRLFKHADFYFLSSFFYALVHSILKPHPYSSAPIDSPDTLKWVRKAAKYSYTSIQVFSALLLSHLYSIARPCFEDIRLREIHLCQQPSGDCLTAKSGLAKNHGLRGPIQSLAKNVPRLYLC